MARSTRWWSWVQRWLDAYGWSPADLARAVKAETGGDGPDESVIGRWKTRGATPTNENIRVVAKVLKRDVREALIASGLFTARELNAPWPDYRTLLASAPDEDFADEAQARLTRRRHSPATVGSRRPPKRASHVGTAPAQVGGTQHTLTRDSAEGALSPIEGGGAPTNAASCG